MNGLSSRLVASTSCGRTSPRRSMVLDMLFRFLKWSYRMRSGIALPRPSYAVGSNGDEGSDPAVPGPARLFAVQLDDQLFLRRDRNAGPLRAFQHPAAERLLVDGQ